MRPSIRQLEYLVALAETLNFREGAKKCHVTQPALSAQVAQLEDLLDLKLFERDSRQVLLTASGKELAERAAQVLASLDELVDLAHTLADPLAGTLRLGVIPTLAPYLLPRAMPLMKKRFKRVRVLLREDQTPRLLHLLHTGELDVLLLALEADLGNVETRAIFEDPFVFAMPKTHAYTKRKLLKDTDLEGEAVLLLEDGHCLRDQAWSVCAAAGAHELGDVRATSLGTLSQMVSAGIGVTLLPSTALPIEKRNPGLATRPFAKPVPFRTVGLAWRKTSPRAELFEAVADALRSLEPE
jgi:LysR family hydrogen peroxide-inducible transcriptional activator